MHKCAGLSIPKSILNYCLIDFRSKKETKRKKIVKDILCTGLNSHFLTKWIFEQYQNSVMDKATVHQYAFCPVPSVRSRILSSLMFLFHKYFLLCASFLSAADTYFHPVAWENKCHILKILLNSEAICLIAYYVFPSS